LDGIQPAVKAALTKAYKEASKSRVVRAADLITLPGLKKAPRKRIAAILEPVDPVDGALPEESGDALVESEEESTPDAEDTGEFPYFLYTLSLLLSSASYVLKKMSLNCHPDPKILIIFKSEMYL